MLSCIPYHKLFMAQYATVHGVAESDPTEWLNNEQQMWKVKGLLNSLSDEHQELPFQYLKI